MSKQYYGGGGASGKMGGAGGLSLQKTQSAMPMTVQSYEHYAIGHPDLRSAVYKHIDLVRNDVK
jgi:hypothetical protein